MNPLLDPNARLVIGHRGASAEAPENTLAAFRLALQHGADALELDVHVTADGVPVVLHDPTLDRTTDRSGAVAVLPWDVVRVANAAARFRSGASGDAPWSGDDIMVPSLARVIDTFPLTPLLIEIKTPAATLPVARTIREHDAARRVVAAAFEAVALRGLRELGITVGASRRDAMRLVLAAYLGIPATTGPRCYTIPDRHRGLPVPTDRVVATARRLGRPVHVWTVDDPERARTLWARGVCGVITNRPAVLRAARAAAVAPAATRV